MQFRKKTVTNVRAVTLMVVFLLGFSLLFGRLVYIQAAKEVNGEDLKQIAEERWTKKRSLEGQRGTIFDRNGSTLAQEITSYTMYAVLREDQPNHVKDPRKTAELLAPLIDVQVDDLEQRLLRNEQFQVELGPNATNMSHELMSNIVEFDLPGIFFRKEPRRYYPKQTYASHIIGYTERDMNKSRMGLELSLDEYLRGEDGFVQYQSDRKGIRLPNPNEIINPPKHGYDVYLTFDSNIQTALEQVMTKVEEEYEPERIIAIVSNPKNGQILAMSNRPSFNPNRYEEITNYINYAVSDRFEPGSTMKMFTLAAAIEEGLYNGQELFQSGTYRIGNRTISDHNRGRGWGMISYEEGMARSSNVAFSKIALEKLGPEKLYEYVDRFGLSQPTGIDLPNEATGLIANSYTIDAATTAFGQATAITPIQQVQAASAIANGGTMMKPYVIDRVVNTETGTVIEQNNPEEVGTPISEDTAKEMLHVLEQVVVSPAGTGKPYQIEGFDVVGKTGTAQIPNPNGGGYIQGQNQNIFSFLGMAPKDDPRVVVYVAVDRPKLKPVEAGSAPVSQIFNTVMKQSLQYLNITPSYTEMIEEKQEGVVLENYEGKPISSVEQELLAKGLEVIKIGNGQTIEAQQPIPNSAILEGERVLLRTDGDSYVMPMVEGWSFRDVMKLSNVMELKPNIFGSGFVFKQSVNPGAEIQKGDYIHIELEEPSTETNDAENEDEEEVEASI
ncbi:penicillin-binding protein [Bacillus sp. FJAT-45350]|uniref:penicillin-binding protein n=1 Tax=Bacillus sp. FJAT-45350 TaxID=2011014 RepID=UPI000BB8CABA|nr:penicillin-binding protein [Bacillus sp. FJAT-45350]